MERRQWIWLGVVTVLGIGMAIQVVTIVPLHAKPYLRDLKPVVLAHQGASGHAPSNTMKAFALGLEQGADIIELDVHMTRDGVVVVSHDDTIDRMTNGTGAIKDMSLNELRQYDFGHQFTPDGGQTYPYRLKGVTIPTLEEVFQRFTGVRANIEIKQDEPPMEEMVWDLVRKYQMEDKVLINAFSSAPGQRWATLSNGRTAMGANRNDMYQFAAYYLPYLDWLYRPQVDAFQLPTSQKLGPVRIQLDTPRLINRAHALGIKVHYWTINDEETMRRLIGAGADGIITDYPDRAVKVLTELGHR